ncbi:Na+/H+ antiporter [Paenibacillus gorillae]|uniref:Na+/H+ antiporter n=1 Tax=Paenibacillus gorillae TaxID=1243662 RepID=UPI001EE23ED0|nr:Na+/H+ antiporter [Paenibacillus gorillae]
MMLAILGIITLIAVSHVLNRIVPFIPVPIIQIVLGILLAFLPTEMHIPLDPELFMVLFIAPLLFNDGKVTPREELWKLRAPILLLAVGLVFVTVLIGGYTINAWIPTIPLAAAFGLAAILSPTDAVAVSSISARVHLPKKIHRLLEGEALMNDASGLVAFKFAIAATVTGAFSIWQASFSFVVIAVGGLLFGAFLGLVIIWIRAMLRRFGMEDVTVHMMLVIVTPFLIYILAEELGLSGILAAVAGGVIHAVERDKIHHEEVELRVVSDSTWSVILFVLNGFVFVLLGLQIPEVMTAIFEDQAHNNLQVVGYVFLLYALLIVIRCVWLFLSNRFANVFFRGQDIEQERTSWLSILLLSVSGVRGTLTLAGAFSIPLFLDNGQIFPERDLIIFLAAGVILLSLIAASIALPLLTSNAEQLEEAGSDPSKEALKKSIKAAIAAAQHARTDENDHAAAAVISAYNQKLASLKYAYGPADNQLQMREDELELRRLAIEAERKHLNKLVEEGEVKPEESKRIQTFLSGVELVLTNRWRMFWMLLKGLLRKLAGTANPDKKFRDHALSPEERLRLRQIRIRTSEAAIEALKQVIMEGNKTAAYKVIAGYNRRLTELRRQQSADEGNEQFEEQKKELQLACIQAERNQLQCLYEQSELSRKQLNKLQMMVSYREADIIEENAEEA